jgi:hypothetical protein
MSNSVKVRERQTTVKGKTYLYWLVDCGVVDGKRGAKQFSSKSEAERYATKQRLQRRRYGELAFKLSDTQRSIWRLLFGTVLSHGCHCSSGFAFVDPMRARA